MNWMDIYDSDDDEGVKTRAIMRIIAEQLERIANALEKTKEADGQ